MKQNHINYWAFALLILPVVLLLVSGLTWCIGASICSFTFPLALVFTLFMANKIISRQKILYQSIAYCLVCLVAVGALCYFVHDPAFDSNWYHQPGIYLLSHGWNPIYDHHSARVINDTSHIWIDHYAKGQETICATIVAFTGNMEIGKLGNFFLPISSFFFSLVALEKMFVGWSKRKLWLVAFIVAFPPIIWNQLLSFYIDFNLYSIVVIALCSMVLYKEDKVKFLLVFICLLAIAVSVKFNMLLWFGLLYLGFMAYFWRQGLRSMVGYIFVYGIVGVIVSVLTFSFNPYITNTIDHQTPFYPLMGGHSNVDIMSIVEPESFKHYNSVEKILVADFSRPTTGSQSQNYQFPYGGYPLKNLTACGTVDAKLGGAGLLWLDVLILAIILFVLSKAYKTRNGKWYIGLSIAFLATQLLVPGGWFYRYVSYIYLVPLFLLFATGSSVVNGRMNILRKGIYGLLLINCLVAMGATLATTVVANQIEDYYVKCINHSDKSCYSSDLYGFVRKIEPAKRTLGLSKPSKTMEQIPLLPTRVRIYLDYGALNRDVKTNFIQELLLKKGVLK